MKKICCHGDCGQGRHSCPLRRTLTPREQSAIAKLACVMGGWLMAIALVAVIALAQSLDQQDAQAEQQHAERQARAERADTFEQLDAKACQMIACDRIGK